ncbi:MAG: type I-E CRISPR-associated protein Cas6/Cse3/CasE [Desulfovibrionaceae bacterium]|nr:type I-E CRISPR-associated protein Cas6/Cse3/CasE [Desulfovibrionaceae bacterium]
MAFLCQYSISLPDARALRLTDTYSLHRIVYSLFPQGQSRAAASRSILFADKGGDARSRRLLILADRQPIVPEYGILKFQAIPEVLFDFSSYRFEIIVNPVRRDNKSGRLIPVCSKEAIAEWFCAKAPQWGFCPQAETMQVSNNFADTFSKAAQSITLNKATITGVFDVHSRDRLMHSTLNGIGRGRAFGCGLLQISPALYQ